MHRRLKTPPSLERLPSISVFPRNYPDVVHIKGETGSALTYRLRRRPSLASRPITAAKDFCEALREKGEL